MDSGRDHGDRHGDRRSVVRGGYGADEIVPDEELPAMVKLLDWNNRLWLGFALMFAGATWLRYRWRYYRIEDPTKVC
jgi:hypothetical protein